MRGQSDPYFSFWNSVPLAKIFFSNMVYIANTLYQEAPSLTNIRQLRETAENGGHRGIFIRARNTIEIIYATKADAKRPEKKRLELDSNL